MIQPWNPTVESNPSRPWPKSPGAKDHHADRMVFSPEPMFETSRLKLSNTMQLPEK
jgi:hypothetical protein